MRRTHFAVLALTAAALSLPVGGAQAGFFTSAVKGAIQNSARHAKQSAKDAVDAGKFLGSCVVGRITGRGCHL
jgi:hypothetical protein